MKSLLTAVLLSVLTITSGFSQIDTPRPSPLAITTQKVGLTDFTVTYSRPSAKGRKVFGDVVPMDKIWRTGANMATIFKADSDFIIDGQTVPAGEYALFAIPGASEWTMILSKTAKQSGTSNYKQEEDQLRFKVKAEAYPVAIESFTIQFASLRDDAATVELLWENTRVAFDVNVKFDERVMKQIDEVMAGPGAGSYYNAASYYYKNNKDLKKALEWVNKALDSNERYWIMSLKAQIQAGLNDYSGAILTAAKAKDIASKEGDDAYVKMNEDRAAEWATKATETKSGKKK
jgi:tetratricopeptide (TPR) repeat protein